MTGGGSEDNPAGEAIDPPEAAAEAGGEEVARRFGGSVDGASGIGDGGEPVVMVDEAEAAPRRRFGGPRGAFRGGGLGR